MKTRLTLRRLFGILAIVLGCTLVILSMATLVSANGGGVPIVDGLYTGDEANYTVLGSADGGRGTLYYNRDGSTLYLAVVVSNTVNDNVFGDTKDTGDETYLQSAGWSGNGNQHRGDALIQSDNVELKLQCGDNTYEWIQGYLYDADGDQDPGEADWLSDPLDGSGGGGYWPTVLISSTSSLQWNLNNGTWDVTLGGTRSDSKKWKSPFDTPNQVPASYPDFDATHQWEWAMVYEMSIDVSACGTNDIIISVPSAHNSPSKDGTEDVPICPPDDPCVLDCEIGDRVWHDYDGLGDQENFFSLTEPGFNGVRLYLFRDDGDGIFEPGATTPGRDGSFLTWTTTAGGTSQDPDGWPDGIYEFDMSSHGTGKYWIWVNERDLPDPDVNKWVSTTGNNPFYLDYPGGDDFSIDFGYVEGGSGSSGGKIGDRVWHDEDYDGFQTGI